MPELSHFPLKMSCLCSMILVMTFFLVSPIYRALQVQANWSTPGKLLGSSFDLSLHIKFFKLHLQVKMIFMANFYFSFFNWDSIHATLNSHYEAWSYNKKKHEKIKTNRTSVQKEPTLKRCLLTLDLKPCR